MPIGSFIVIHTVSSVTIFHYRIIMYFFMCTCSALFHFSVDMHHNHHLHMHRVSITCYIKGPFTNHHNREWGLLDIHLPSLSAPSNDCQNLNTQLIIFLNALDMFYVLS